MQGSGQYEVAAINHMWETMEHRLAQLLLARFLLLNLLDKEAHSGNQSQQNLRRLWVLLQVQPILIFGTDFEVDVFTELSHLLRNISIPALKVRIYKKYKELSHLLEVVHYPNTKQERKLPFFCVVDESQAAVLLRMGEYRSEDFVHKRPLLKELYRSWTSMLSPFHMRVVLSGTGITLFLQTLGSSAFKGTDYSLKSCLGAFDDVAAQTEYIQ